MNIIHNIEIIFRQFVSCAAPVFLIFSMSDFKCKKRTAGIVLSGIIVLGTVICSLILFTVSTERMRQLYFIILLVPSLVFLLAATKDRLSQIFFNYFTAINVFYLTSIISHYLLGNKEEPIWADVLIRMIIFSLVVFIFVRYLKEAYHFLSINMKNNWRVISLIPFMFFALVMFLGLYPHTRSDNLAAVVFLYIILAFVYYIIYQIFRNTYDLLNQQRDNDALKQQVNALVQQMDLLNRNENQLRIYRHDIRHLSSNAISLLQEGEIKKALQLLESFSEWNQNTQIPEYCKNVTVNAILALYLQKAIDEGITVSARCDIPEMLPVDALEFSMVCANAIENAVHACEKLPEGSAKHIQIRCISHPQLVLEISNSYNGHVRFDENHYPVSEEEGHGIGTRSIIYFAKKYEALLDYKAEPNIFRLRLLINND